MAVVLHPPRTLARTFDDNEECGNDAGFLLELCTHLNLLAYKIPDPQEHAETNTLFDVSTLVKVNFKLTPKGYVRYWFIRTHGYRPTDNDPLFLLSLASFNVPY